MTNSVDFAASFLALVWLGAIPVLQNSQFGRSELEHITNLTEPTGFLFAGSNAEPATEGLANSAWRAHVSDGRLISDPGDDFSGSGEWPPSLNDVTSDTPAFIVFTSGTTGRPKGIVHAHRWLEALGDSNRARIPPQDE